jgi:hypothetical protein
MYAVELLKDYYKKQRSGTTGSDDSKLVSDQDDLPIFYVPSSVESVRGTVILHNRFCHTLYDIVHDGERDENEYLPRVERRKQTVLVFNPRDELFLALTPVFCKNCKRYVGNTDVAIPYQIAVQDQDDDWSRYVYPYRWNDEKTSYTIPDSVVPPSGIVYFAGAKQLITLPEWPLSDPNTRLSTLDKNTRLSMQLLHSEEADEQSESSSTSAYDSYDGYDSHIPSDSSSADTNRASSSSSSSDSKPAEAKSGGPAGEPSPVTTTTLSAYATLSDLLQQQRQTRRGGGRAAASAAAAAFL